MSTNKIGTFREWLRESELNEGKIISKEIKYAVNLVADKIYSSNPIKKVTGNENKILITSKMSIDSDKQQSFINKLKENLSIEYIVSDYKEYSRISEYILTLIKK